MPTSAGNISRNFCDKYLAKSFISFYCYNLIDHIYYFDIQAGGPKPNFLAAILVVSSTFFLLKIFELCSRKVGEMFVYKHTETIQYVKK